MNPTPPPGGRRYKVIVCRGPECGERRHSAAIAEAFRAEARRLGPEIEHHVELGHQACFGRCRQGPNVMVRLVPQGPLPGRQTLLATPPVGRADNAALYGGVTEGDVAKILQSHVGRGIIVRELVRRPEEVVDPKGGPSEHDTDGARSTSLSPPAHPKIPESGER